MNRDDKFNAEMTQAFKRIIRDANNISKKYDRDPYVLLKLLGSQIVELANKQQYEYAQKVKAIETLRAVSEVNKE